MKNLILMLVVMLTLACQATANTVLENHQPSVVSAFLGEPYIAALLSLLVLIATLIWIQTLLDLNSSSYSSKQLKAKLSF